VAISINGGAGRSYHMFVLCKENSTSFLAHNISDSLEMPGWFDL